MRKPHWIFLLPSVSRPDWIVNQMCGNSILYPRQASKWAWQSQHWANALHFQSLMLKLTHWKPHHLQGQFDPEVCCTIIRTDIILMPNEFKHLWYACWLKISFDPVDEFSKPKTECWSTPAFWAWGSQTGQPSESSFSLPVKGLPNCSDLRWAHA